MNRSFDSALSAQNLRARGAHLYGFASPDSDVDLRGAFLLPARDLLGLHPSAETVTLEGKTRIDLDWVAHDTLTVLLASTSM